MQLLSCDLSMDFSISALSFCVCLFPVGLTNSASKGSVDLIFPSKCLKLPCYQGLGLGFSFCCQVTLSSFYPFPLIVLQNFCRTT